MTRLLKFDFLSAISSIRGAIGKTRRNTRFTRSERNTDAFLTIVITFVLHFFAFKFHSSSGDYIEHFPVRFKKNIVLILLLSILYSGRQVSCDSLAPREMDIIVQRKSCLHEPRLFVLVIFFIIFSHFRCTYLYKHP